MAASTEKTVTIPYVDDFRKFYYPMKHLGAGAYSVVYRCYHKKTLEKVALKIVTCDRYDKKRVELVLSEIKALEMLNDAGLQFVPKIHNFFACNATDVKLNLVIVMEFINGMTLREFVINGYMNDDNYARICYWLFDIISKIHERDVVHRDIKPDNIVINQLDSSNIYLIDFGFSCSTKPSVNLSNCELGSSKGSLGYAAPEIVDGTYTTLDVLKKSDVFSAAATLKSLVEPVRIENFDTKIRLKHRPPISLVLEKCLDFDPVKRPTAAWSAQILRNYFKF